jgi:periplasmic divalent cation tolerance protein
MNAHHRLMLCTCPDQETAQQLADQLVNERLAACVSLVPGIISTYRWKGEIHREPEVQLLIKTTIEQVEQLIERLRQLHPYDVPEIIAIPIREGLTDYLNWITACTTGQE